MTKAELEARVKVLEAELAVLKVRVAQRPAYAPVYPYLPYWPGGRFPYTPVWCGTKELGSGAEVYT